MTQIFQTLLTMAVVVGMALAAPTPEISELRNVSLANVSSSTVASTSSNSLVSSTEVARVDFIGAKELTSTAVPMKPVTEGNVNGGKLEEPIKPVTGENVNNGKPEEPMKPVTGGNVNGGKLEEPMKPVTGGNVNDGKPEEPMKPVNGGNVNGGKLEEPMKPVTGGNVNGGKPEEPQCHGGVGGNGGGLFDKILAIFIRIWQAINKYLNTKQPHQGLAAGVDAPCEQNSNGTSEKANYNEIFNIPIAVFRYVRNMFREGGAGLMIWKNFKANISGVN